MVIILIIFMTTMLRKFSLRAILIKGISKLQNNTPTNIEVIVLMLNVLTS